MKILTFWILCIAAIALTGCLSKPALQRETFLFATPTEKRAAANGPILALRKISVAPQFNSLAFNYRTGDFSYEQDPYAGFLVAPDECMAAPIRARLESIGVFSAVIGPGSALKADMEVEISVPQLYGDFRDRSRPLAVLEMRFIILRKEGHKVIFQKDYMQKIPLKTRTAAALMAGWNEALEKILGELSSNLKNNLHTSPQ